MTLYLGAWMTASIDRHRSWTKVKSRAAVPSPCTIRGSPRIEPCVSSQSIVIDLVMVIAGIEAVDLPVDGGLGNRRIADHEIAASFDSSSHKFKRAGRIAFAHAVPIPYRPRATGHRL